MRIADYIKSALIIDNKEEEIKGLQDVLLSEGTYFTFYTPKDIDNDEKSIKNHQIIFMDFSLDDTKKPIDNIALIRKALKKICSDNFGSYGLVLWTKHMEYIQEVKMKLSIDSENNTYTTPLFVVGLDKSAYLQNGYRSLWDDLNSQLLENNAALFFFNWRNSVDAASDNALNNMYHLVPNYNEQTKGFLYLLYQMAKNYSGIPTDDLKVYDGMHTDAYRAFDELLYSDLISQQSKLENIFPETIEKPDYSFEKELDQIAKINSRQLLDLSITDQNIVLPGNVYKIVKSNSFLELKGAPKRQKYNPIPLAIEMTPPCDFAHKKLSSRLVGGIMINCPTTPEKLSEYVNSTFKAD